VGFTAHALAMLLAAAFFSHPSTMLAILAYALLTFIVAFAIAAGFRRWAFAST
jgi:predicted Na+-dependent transporter